MTFTEKEFTFLIACVDITWRTGNVTSPEMGDTMKALKTKLETGLKATTTTTTTTATPATTTETELVKTT